MYSYLILVASLVFSACTAHNTEQDEDETIIKDTNFTLIPCTAFN